MKRRVWLTLFLAIIVLCAETAMSTVVALMAAILRRKAYEVMVLDGDASNPEGLVRLLFGLGVEGEPKPLIEFFGGINAVTCPVDDPSPLTRINHTNPVPQNRINVLKEIPPEYYLRKGSMILLQVGKIEAYGQGCDQAGRFIEDRLFVRRGTNIAP
jgi:CO dehydrogenase maturation factor